MPGRGLGGGVILVGVREARPLLKERGDPAGELRAVAIEIVGPQLVDGDADHEFRSRRRREGADAQQGEERQERCVHVEQNNSPQTASTAAATGSPRGTRVAISNASAMITAQAKNGTLGPRC